MCSSDLGNIFSAPLKLHMKVSDKISPKILRSDGAIGSKLDFAYMAAEKSVEAEQFVSGNAPEPEAAPLIRRDGVSNPFVSNASTRNTGLQIKGGS